jgi:hypothetical protein
MMPKPPVVVVTGFPLSSLISAIEEVEAVLDVPSARVTSEETESVKLRD